MQLSLFAPPAPTIKLDPLGEAIYRFRRDGQWWDGRTWVSNEHMALQAVGDRCLADELAIVGKGVEVINEEGKVI
jgi:hypothetical protein